jgi:hypothetical protein
MFTEQWKDSNPLKTPRFLRNWRSITVSLIVLIVIAMYIHQTGAGQMPPVQNNPEADEMPPVQNNPQNVLTQMREDKKERKRRLKLNN